MTPYDKAVAKAGTYLVERVLEAVLLTIATKGCVCEVAEPLCSHEPKQAERKDSAVQDAIRAIEEAKWELDRALSAVEDLEEPEPKKQAVA